jgi:hypothetical protein
MHLYIYTYIESICTFIVTIGDNVMICDIFLDGLKIKSIVINTNTRGANRTNFARNPFNGNINQIGPKTPKRIYTFQASFKEQ